MFTSRSRESGVGLGPRGVFSGRRRRFRKIDGQDSSVVLTSSFSGTSQRNQTVGPSEKGIEPVLKGRREGIRKLQGRSALEDARC